jgi:Domain of unknown function (DUF222)/HNH endonuclease
VAIPAPASTSEAMDMVLAGLRCLAVTDPDTLASQAQANCLQTLEHADAISTAARARILSAFATGQGYADDADYNAKTWLIHRTRVTEGVARGHVGWSRRVVTHPQILAALAEGTVLTESMARTICRWTDKLPEECRPPADAILITAARAGARQEDLASLAAEIYARSLPQDDDDPEQSFEDRQVRVETTFGGAGVIAGNLTPECAAVVTAVLDALSTPADADDPRTKEQRYHDGLQEAMRRLIASRLLPERAGQPVKVWAHVTLAELRALDDGSVLADQWVTEMAVRWAARRAEDSEGGGDGGAWLTGKAVKAMACDAAITPIVTGDIDPSALDDLVRLCVELDRLEHGSDLAAPPVGAQPDPSPPTGTQPDLSPSSEALRKAIIGKAVDLLSGPGGLASFLRTQQLGARLAGPSLPLDIGFSKTIPPGIRNAVILRDRRCRWPGCRQPAKACEVHHVKHIAHGGPTSLTDCVLLCSYHHQIVIHRWGWTLVLNSDGTTTAWNPDRTKILHSHSPPARAG